MNVRPKFVPAEVKMLLKLNKIVPNIRSNKKVKPPRKEKKSLIVRIPLAALGLSSN